MKLVREHINEKFEEDSDPIKDLDIGNIFKSIKPGDFIKNKKNYTFYNRFEDPSLETQEEQKQTIGVISGVKKSVNALTLTFFPFNTLSEMSRKRWAVRYNDEEYTKGYYTVNYNATYENWAEFWDLIPNEDILKESLNEKFEEDSDPIDDLRIGTK